MLQFAKELVAFPELSDDDLATLDNCIPNSSIPDAIATESSPNRAVSTKKTRSEERYMQRTNGYKTILGEIRMQDFDDPYGTTMGILFGIASVAYVEYDTILPEFEPGILRKNQELDDYPGSRFQEMVWYGEIDLSDIKSAYLVMQAYYAMIPEDLKY